MKYKEAKEGKVKIILPENSSVFFNPEAEMTRDLSVSALQVYKKGIKFKINVCDPLAATGIRGLRYAKEVKGIKSVVLNDKNPKAYQTIKKNIKLNKLKKCSAENKDANILLRSNVFNAIDLDPFGSPNVFMDSAARSIWHRGFLMVTATDTAPLSGTYPEACLRKYGIKSLKTDFYTELGLRILISFIILNMTKYERIFVPQLSFSTLHYFRVFGKIEHAGKIKDILKDFGYVNYCACGNRIFGDLKEICNNCGKSFKHCGLIYLGKINDKKFIKDILTDLEKRNFKMKKREEKLLRSISGEIETPFYYDIHILGKIFRIGEIPKIEDFIGKIKSKGFKASRSSICPTGVKTDANFKYIKNLF